MTAAMVRTIEDDLLRGAAPVAADLPELLELLGDPRVGATLGGVRSEAAVAETIGRWGGLWSERGLGPWLFRLREGGALVGYAGLAPAAEAVAPGSLQLLYALRPGFWGRGLATRMSRLALGHAFSERGVSQVVSYTLRSNRGSRRVLEQLGFSFERDVEHAGLPHLLYRLRRSPG